MPILSRMINNYKRYTTRKSIAAVHEDDFESLLSQLGLLDDLYSGRLTCAACGSTVNNENIAAWAKGTTGLLFFCDSSDCLPEALAQLSGGAE